MIFKIKGDRNLTAPLEKIYETLGVGQDNFSNGIIVFLRLMRYGVITTFTRMVPIFRCLRQAQATNNEQLPELVEGNEYPRLYWYLHE
jgi:hypothetical protein